MARSNLTWLLIASLPIIILLAYQTGSRNHEPSIDRSKIAVVFAGITAYAHLEKAQPLVAGLVEAGYPVTFITGEEFRNFSLSTGAHFEPLDGPYGMVTEQEFADFITNPGDGESKLASAVFLDHMEEHLYTVQRVFRKLTSKYEKIVYIHDTSFLALLPVQLGAPGLLPTVSMGLGIANIGLDSQDTFPFQARQPPDTSENARRIHRKAYQNIQNPIRLALDKGLQQKLKEMDAIEPYPNFYHSFGSLDDYLVQLGIPEFEYKRRDLVPKLRFLGLPEKPGGSRDLPLWWQDVVDARAAGKKIVVVCQGTASFNLEDLLIPTLQALKDRNDVLVVGTTVTQEPDGIETPSNARLAKFVPFDVLLPQASVLISTGGFGTVLHSIKAGIPMILAGLLQDKAHVATLAEHVGVAANLKTDKPSIETIQKAVNKVINDVSYVNNIRRLQQASKKYNPVKRLDSAIIEALST